MEHSRSNHDSSSLIQSIGVGFHPGCGVDESSYLVPTNHFAEPRISLDLPASYPSQERMDGPYVMTADLPRLSPIEKSQRGNRYSEKTFTFAVTSSAVLALLLGFLVGFLFSRWCQRKDSNPKCSHAYLEAQILERSNKEPSSSIYETAYTNCNSPGGLSVTSTTKNNLLSNQPVKSDTTKKNLSVNNSSGGTLGKCKKVYI